MKKILLINLALFLSIGLQLHAQEICDNAIDDDGDGLIDLNDDDCYCPSLVASSLIPNPSFEEMTCCPTANEMLHCAVDWIQASTPTTDYVHTCGGFLGNTSIPAYAPLPFPDGEGGVGFRDGQAQAGINYKEYVGACLTEPMEVGVTYKMDFFVGFQNNVTGSTSLNLAIFGSVDCNDLPFGGNDYTIGCPVNTGDYIQLGETFVSGSNEWVNVVFEFEATQPYEVIVLGPGCEGNSNYLLDPYFYLDGLSVAESSQFGTSFEQITGSICENDLILQVIEHPDFTYQWYQDGIALIGETNHFILLTSIDNTEGIYTVVTTTPSGCTLSQEYELLIPPYYENEFVSICEGETYDNNGALLSESGLYETYYEAVDGCDSIFQLQLEIRPNSYAEVRDTFCEGDTYNLHDISTTTGGTYETTLTNTLGCDSILTVQLTGIGMGEGVDIPDFTIIDLGETILLTPLYYDPIYTQFTWTDESGTILGNDPTLSMYQPVRETTIYLTAADQNGCTATDSLTVRVITNPTMYVPNVFSPDGNGINDYFRFYPPIGVEKVLSFTIFDRWGGLIFQDDNIEAFQGYKGWDGTVEGEKALQGVYCYMIKVRFLDGEEKIIAGDVLLLR